MVDLNSAYSPTMIQMVKVPVHTTEANFPSRLTCISFVSESFQSLCLPRQKIRKIISISFFPGRPEILLETAEEQMKQRSKLGTLFQNNPNTACSLPIKISRCFQIRSRIGSQGSAKVGCMRIPLKLPALKKVALFGNLNNYPLLPLTGNYVTFSGFANGTVPHEGRQGRKFDSV